jgi:uncharacterized repeat protein (TIGR02543 family)
MMKKIAVVAFLFFGIFATSSCKSNSKDGNVNVDSTPYKDNQEIRVNLANFAYQNIEVSFDLNENTEFHILYYDMNADGNPDYSEKYYVGDQVVLPEIPESGHNSLFLGWMDMNTNTLFDFYKPITRDVYLVPVFYEIDYNLNHVNIGDFISINFLVDDTSTQDSAYSFYSYYEDTIDVYTSKLESIGGSTADPDIIAIYKLKNGVPMTADNLQIINDIDISEGDYNTKATFQSEANTAYYVIILPYQNDKYRIGSAELHIEGRSSSVLGSVELPQFSPSSISSQIITFNDQMSFPEIPVSSTGHYFAGWYTNSECSGTQFNFSYDIGTDIKLYAKWTEYEVDLNQNDGGLLKLADIPSLSYVLYANSTFTLPVSDSANFVGWYTEPNGQGIKLTDNLGVGVFDWNSLLPDTIYPYFYYGSFKVFINEGDNILNTLPIPYGEKINMDDIFYEGYNIIGLFKDELLEQEFDINNKIYNEQHLYIKRIPNDYNINYNLNNGEFDDTEITTSYNVETSTFTLKIPTRYGYNFMGWYTEETFINLISVIKQGTTENKELYAKWEPKIVSVTLDYQDEISQNKLIDVTFGSKYNLEIPTREGYIFDGWYLQYNGEEILVHYYINGWDTDCTEVQLDFNHTLYAKWTYGSSELKLQLVQKDPERKVWQVFGIDSNQVTHIVIPNEYLGYRIEFIGANAFSGATNLESIVIPDTVSEIGANAFMGTSSLHSIDIPSSMTTIGDGTFSGANGLTSLVIPESVTSIGANAFSGATNLESIVIPDTVSEIGANAFMGTSSLRSIDIPSSMTTIGDSAFSGANGLTSLVIPESVISIGANAFSGATNLESIVIPNNVVKIGDGAFSGTISLRHITLPFIGETRNSTGTSTYFGFIFGSSYYDESYMASGYYIPNNLDTVAITDAITIEDNAFSGVRLLKNISIPNTVRSIGSSAFSGAFSLESIVVPNSVISIGKDAFSGMFSLNSISLPFVGATRNSTGIAAYFGYVFGTSYYSFSYYTGDLYCSGGTCYKGFYIPQSLSNVTITDATYIAESAFFGVSSMESITLPFVGRNRNENLYAESSFGYIFGETSYSNSYSTSSPYGNFYIPNSLSKITITDTTYIGSIAFQGLSNVEHIILSNSITWIGGSAFKYTSSLTSIIIPNSVNFIGYGAFYGSSVETIYAEALSQPSGWDSSWNSANKPVTWAYRPSSSEIDSDIINSYFNVEFYDFINPIFSKDYDIRDLHSDAYPVDLYIVLSDWADTDAIEYDNMLNFLYDWNDEYGYVVGDYYVYIFLHEVSDAEGVYVISIYQPA